MFQNLISYLTFGNHFCGIEHSTINDQEYLYLTILKKSKQAIDIENRYKVISIQEIANTISKKQHIHVTINNSEVLTKSVENSNDDPELIVYTAFPNIDLNDFYYEVISQDTLHIVSICRKSYVDDILNTYKELKLIVINISLGNSIISSIKNFLNVNLVRTSNAIIKLDKGKIISLKRDENRIEEHFNVNGLEVNNYFLLSLVSGLETIIQHSTSKSNLKEVIKKLSSNFNQARFFDQFLRFGLGFLILLLLTNFMIFSTYFNKVETLKQTSQVHTETKHKIDELIIQVDKKQNLVNDVIYRDISKSSFYTNEIIQSLPHSIVLSEFNFHPLKKTIKNNEPILVHHGIIYVSGKSSDNGLFSDWITQLEALPWIDTIITIAYSDVSPSTSIFSIKINTAYAI